VRKVAQTLVAQCVQAVEGVHRVELGLPALGGLRRYRRAAEEGLAQAAAQLRALLAGRLKLGRVRVVAAVLTLIVPVVPFETVNPRSVVTLAPVYESVPPPNTRLEVALLDLPMLLLPPPLASVVTLSVPALIVVIPV
jgi:hypothetical protein